jgi:hypothetical protein
MDQSAIAWQGDIMTPDTAFNPSFACRMTASCLPLWTALGLLLTASAS